MRWIERIRRVNETLLDLVIGCLIYGFVFELIGLLAVPDRTAWTLGLLLGILAAIGMSISMYMGIDSALSMDPQAAGRSMTIQSILRLLVMLLVGLLAIRVKQISFPAVVVGLLGLKVSAHLHIYTNVYITSRLKIWSKKGGG